MKNTFSKAAAIAIAATYFGTYPSVNTFHVTADEQVFEGANDALNNAKQLDPKDPIVIAVSRDESEAVHLDEKTLSDNPELKTGEKTATTKAPLVDDITLKDNDVTNQDSPDNTVTAKAGGDDAAKSAAAEQIDNAKANATNAAKNADAKANNASATKAGAGKGKAAKTGK